MLNFQRVETSKCSVFFEDALVFSTLLLDAIRLVESLSQPGERRFPAIGKIWMRRWPELRFISRYWALSSGCTCAHAQTHTQVYYLLASTPVPSMFTHMHIYTHEYRYIHIHITVYFSSIYRTYIDIWKHLCNLVHTSLQMKMYRLYV